MMTVRELIRELLECPLDADVNLSEFRARICDWQGGNTAPVGEVVVGLHSDGEWVVYLDPRKPTRSRRVVNEESE